MPPKNPPIVGQESLLSLEADLASAVPVTTHETLPPATETVKELGELALDEPLSPRENEGYTDAIPERQSEAWLVINHQAGVLLDKVHEKGDQRKLDSWRLEYALKALNLVDELPDSHSFKGVGYYSSEQGNEKEEKAYNLAMYDSLEIFERIFEQTDSETDGDIRRDYFKSSATGFMENFGYKLKFDDEAITAYTELSMAVYNLMFTYCSVKTPTSLSVLRELRSEFAKKAGINSLANYPAKGLKRAVAESWDLIL